MEGEAVGRSSVRAGDLDPSRSVTCTSPQDDATVKCWGGSDVGQLGYDDMSNRGDSSSGAFACPTHPRLWR